MATKRVATGAKMEAALSSPVWVSPVSVAVPEVLEPQGIVGLWRQLAGGDSGEALVASIAQANAQFISLSQYWTAQEVGRSPELWLHLLALAHARRLLCLSTQS